jgi:hypothetical protein
LGKRTLGITGRFPLPAKPLLTLADHLERTNGPHKKMAGEMKAFFGRMAAAMRVWVETCRQIGC